MARLLYTDNEWECILDLFSEPAMTGILWILCAGSPSQDLPEGLGGWQTFWRLFARWNGDGLLDTALRRLRASHAEAGEISNELWCIDASIVKVADCSTGSGQKRDPKEPTDHALVVGIVRKTSSIHTS